MMQIEAVIPKLGIEMDETTFPQEVGLEEYLNFKKGCFIGAEVLQRIFYQGHVNRALVLLGLGECRNRVKNLKVFEESEEVGKITRSIFSLPRNRVTALGLLKVSALDSKKSLYARDGEEKILLEVLKQPQMQRQ
jgi:folate-binding protein YgfZ